MDWTLEIPWVLVSTVAVGICAALLGDAIKDRQVVRRTNLKGPARLIAERGVSTQGWRLVAVTATCAAAWISWVMIPVATYTYTGQFLRNHLWLVVSAALLIQGIQEHRTRRALFRDLDLDRQGDVSAPVRGAAEP